MPRYQRSRMSVSTILLIVLAIAAVVGVTLYIVNSKREVNDENLLAVKNYEIVDTKTSVGLTVDVKDSGKIYIQGTASEDWSAVIQTVTLKAGTYTVGGCTSDIGKYGIRVTKNGTPIAYAGTDGTLGATFTVEETGSYQVEIFVSEGTYVMRTFAPTLAAGKKAINFYE